MKFLIFVILFFQNACKENQNPKTALNFDFLFGKTIQCKFNDIKTKLFFYSPHVIGVPINENGYEMEYFHSVGSKKNSNSLYFESSFKGKSNFQTIQSESNKLTRRLKITIDLEKLYITAINEINEEKKPVNPVIYECDPTEPINYH